MHKTALFAALIATPLFIWAEQPKTIVKVPITSTSPASGAEMFKSYCAACHGAEGRGNGPAASALKVAPVDLTQLSKRNNGKFPDVRVYQSIGGEVGMPSHGSKEMPVWGELFRSVNGHATEQKLRMHNLTKYLESLQAK